MLLSATLSLVFAQTCFKAETGVRSVDLEIPLTSRVYLFGVQQLALLVLPDGSGALRDLTGTTLGSVGPAMILGGRRSDMDEWIHLESAQGPERVYSLSEFGEFARVGTQLPGDCKARLPNHVAIEEPCINGVLVSQDERGLRIRRATGDVLLPVRSSVKWNGVRPRVLMVEEVDVDLVSSVAELKNLVVVAPRVPTSSFQCASRFCWAVGVSGEVEYLNRSERVWKLAGRVRPRFSEVVVGGEERAFVFDRRCANRLTVLSAR